MTTLLTLLVLATATTRLTRLITIDRITEPARARLISRHGSDHWATYLAHCPWCMSIWVAAALTPILWFTAPALPPAAGGAPWWAGIPALALTVAYAAGWTLTRGEGR